MLAKKIPSSGRVGPGPSQFLLQALTVDDWWVGAGAELATNQQLKLPLHLRSAWCVGGTEHLIVSSPSPKGPSYS